MNGRSRSGTRWLIIATCALSIWAAGTAGADPAAGEDLTQLSLQDLANIEVTSVSKAAEGLNRAAASVYVITQEQIMRSGATSLMEALRLAPNLLVTQVSATDYVISARGFGGNPQSQNFSNKLLMLIDGRSVYTPLYSGIYSDAQDILLEDIDRIEVISGPGATLWGANAMNGVINVITRPSYLTQGSFVDAAAGSREQDLGARYGGRATGDLSYRVYGLGFHREAQWLADGSSAQDGWSKGQGGFRSDWSADENSVTLQGDVYRATEQQPMAVDGSIVGGNILSRYEHHTERTNLQIQAYFDQTQRFGPADGTGFVLHTYDLHFQQSIEAGANRIVWGGGERLNSYAISNAVELLFEPPERNLTLGDIFVQDTFSFTPALSLTAGIKVEDDPYWGWTPLPDIRMSWQANNRTVLWAAASKAIRSPTPFDDDVIEKIGTEVFLAANRSFRPETVMAYEAGSRVDAGAKLSISLTVFYNRYDDLRTIEPFSSTQFLPIYWGNLMQGDTYGVEGWANWQVTEWWRLSPGFTALHENLRFKAGASGILGIAQAADDPSSHADLNSSMNFGRRVSFDAAVRYVGALPDPALPHYFELNGRLAWRATDSVDLSINGLNLLHGRHYEFPSSQGGEAIGRNVMAEARWKF
ncbi:MAG TPA: TonB-dependent receptor [Steroidobacteraceae bacterium]|jgi:iron complex outermembrane receptor protein